MALINFTRSTVLEIGNWAGKISPELKDICIGMLHKAGDVCIVLRIKNIQLNRVSTRFDVCHVFSRVCVFSMDQPNMYFPLSC